MTLFEAVALGVVGDLAFDVVAHVLASIPTAIVGFSLGNFSEAQRLQLPIVVGVLHG